MLNLDNLDNVANEPEPANDLAPAVGICNSIIVAIVVIGAIGFGACVLAYILAQVIA